MYVLKNNEKCTLSVIILLRLCDILSNMNMFLHGSVCHHASNKLSSLTSFPIFENPYPIDIHESPVTCTEYFADCPPDLIPVLYSVGAKHKKQGYSNKVNKTSIFRERKHMYYPCL